jgi:hypothetical protein
MNALVVLLSAIVGALIGAIAVYHTNEISYQREISRTRREERKKAYAQLAYLFANHFILKKNGIYADIEKLAENLSYSLSELELIGGNPEILELTLAALHDLFKDPKDADKILSEFNDKVIPLMKADI